jgi:hypothetical protein
MVTTPAHLHSIIDHDGAVILDIPNNAMTTLNSTGAFVWERLQRGLSIDEIARELAKDTGIEASVVAMDIDAFMEQLKAKHLVNLS